MNDWIPNPNAGHPPHGDLRAFETSHDGPMWQYTSRHVSSIGTLVIYGFGKTPDEAKADARRTAPHD